MEDIRSLSYGQLADALGQMGQKPFRASQVYGWLHQSMADGPDEMTNLPLALREALRTSFAWANLRQAAVRASRDGTRKYLFALEDGSLIESVWMRHRHGNTVCISSQVGCRMGCRFCASGIGGLTRNLLPGEMLGQVYRIRRDVGERVSHIVVMGMGEPLDNYANLVRFLRMISDEKGMRISQRNITVSTCGIVPNIYALQKEQLAITLALSLHAPTQEKRKALMPIANRYGLSETIDACRAYFAATGRRVTFEYSLIRQVNDTQKDARELAGLLCGTHGHVNLIPVNPIRERSFRQSDRRTAMRFQKELEMRGIPATIRRSLGQDIDGACGQLRKSYQESSGDVRDAEKNQRHPDVGNLPDCCAFSDQEADTEVREK